MNLGQDGFMENIQASAYVAIALDILWGILIFMVVWLRTDMQKIFNESKDEYGPWTFSYKNCFFMQIGPIKAEKY